jgi:hypothetical protein
MNTRSSISGALRQLIEDAYADMKRRIASEAGPR